MPPESFAAHIVKFGEKSAVFPEVKIFL